VWLAAPDGIFPQELTPDLGLILDSLPDGVYGVDTTGQTVLVNRAAARMLGYEPAELIGTVPHQVMHHTRPDGTPFPPAECPLSMAGADGRSCSSSSDTFWRRDGTSFPVEYQSQPMTRDGRVVGFLVTFRDISERRRSEERARALLREQFAKTRAEFQYAQLRDVLAQTPALICVTRGARHVIETVNEQFREMVGDRDVIGLTMREAFPGIDHRRLALMDLAYESGAPTHGRELPVDVLAVDGPELRYYTYVYQPLRDETGFVYGLMTHGVNVTREVGARQQLEARTGELVRTHTRLRLAAEAGRLGAWEWEVKTGQVIWSPELERIHGLEPGVFPGTFEGYQSDIHPEDRDRVLGEIARTVVERQPHQLEYRIVPPDGRVRWVEARGQIFLDAAGEPERLVGICMDTTERKQVEEALRERAEQLARLAAALKRTNGELDAFAYAASHDLRAPLRGIANLAQWIEEDLSAEGTLKSETRDMLGLLRSRMHRMEALIDGILEYSRVGRIVEPPVDVDTRRLLEEVIDLLDLPPQAEVAIDGDLANVYSPRLPLQQIFMNLLGNAFKYNLAAVPRVWIGSENAGDNIRFSVRDNGPGIAPEYHGRIWGIFQTLEARDKVEATGIGLSLVKKLVEGQGGRAWVESSPGAGATFHFLWPRVAPSPAEIEAST
jgi:PAS domain S-box-containing protein